MTLSGACLRSSHASACCAALLMLFTTIAAAQNREPTSNPERDERRQRAASSKEKHGDARGDREPADFSDGPRNIFERLPFGPTPADAGPLREGELETLRPFLEQNLPMLARIIERMQNADRPELRRHIDQIAPYIRFLHRTSEENPKRARLMLEHVKSGFMLERARRVMANPQRGPVARERLAADVRAAATRSVQAEMRLLIDYADELRDQFDDRTTLRFEAIIADGAPLADVSPQLAHLLHERASATGDALAEIENRIRALIAGEIREQIRAWRERAEALRSTADEEINQRVSEVLGPEPSSENPAQPTHNPTRPKRDDR
ncbi:MAG: hypothetical protein JNG88_07455 [Phycisphaerales bacterium]|nr:hypothetical protein [Phycisphaerales bacterium]